MLEHQLSKQGKEWHCTVCQWTWKGKPRSECPGVHWYAEKPENLLTELELREKNLNPVGSPAGCMKDRDAWLHLYDPNNAEVLHPYPIVKRYRYDHNELKTVEELKPLNLAADGLTPKAMLWEGGRWQFLYQMADCSIANPDLPTIYPWNDRPDHLYTAKQLERFNFKPGNAPRRGCSWAHWLNDWVWLYDRHDEGFEILDPSLPYCYHYESELPADLKDRWKWTLLNLEPKADAQPQGSYRYWHKQSNHDGEWITIEVYHRNDCKLIDSTLPPCYPKDGYPPELKTERELADLNLAPSSAQPRGCYIRSIKHRAAYPDVELLYHPDDCQWQPKDRFITKTTLRRTYLLSDRWLKRIGDPDLVRDNPHHEKWSEMQLYSRQRVETFLAENAEEYAQWLSERDRYVAIFEQNKEAIAAGRAAAIQSRREARLAELEQQRAQREAERLEWQRRREQLRAEQEARWAIEEPRRAQMSRCLRCISGCATSVGFLCAIHPLGLEDDQIPCPDWKSRFGDES